MTTGLTSLFMRPLSPYGFAIKAKSFAAHDVERWLPFYEEGLDYIIELNRAGIPLVEQYAAIVLKKMLTNDDPGYVDPTSPAGIGIGAIVYNYDGDVYASDEGWMLAEMGDKTFRLDACLRIIDDPRGLLPYAPDENRTRDLRLERPTLFGPREGTVDH